MSTHGSTPLTGSAEKEIANKLALLNEEQRQRYETHLTIGIDSYGTVTDQYRLGVLNTLLQPISEREQGRQIHDHFRKEYYRSFDNDQREAQAARQQTTPTQAPPAQQEAKAPTPAIATPDPAAAQNAERAVERGKTVITFTEYNRPNGRKEEVELKCHSDTKRLADGLVLKGYRFECETLPDKTISLTAVDPKGEDDVAIQLCGRRAEIPNALRSLVNKAVEFDRRQELAGDLVQSPQQKLEPKLPELAAQQAKAPTPADNHQLSGSDHAKEKQADPMEGMRPRSPHYSKLERTHQHVADMQRKGTSQSASERDAAATAPTYTFDTKAEAYIASEVKGMDAHLANDPALRMDFAFKWHIKKDLDPKGPSFESLDAGGALDGQRREFYAQHPNALPRSIEPSAQQPEGAGKPKSKTKQEFLERGREGRAKLLRKAAERRAAGEAMQQGKAGPEQSRQESTQQPGSSPKPKSKSKQEFLEREREGRAKLLQKAEQRRAAKDVTQREQGAQQQNGLNLGGGGISR
jgi:hypothetical protein